MTALMETEQQEQQPISLKLCLYNSNERIVERSFSRDTTLLEVNDEILKVFNIDSGRETRLWINNKIYHAKPGGNVHNGNKEEDDENTTIKKHSSEVKENNARNTNGSNNIGTSSPSLSSMIKPPPTPPPMPANTSTSALQNNSASPNVITRQAAQSLNKQQKPIALTDGSESIIPLLNDPKLTLSKCGLDKPTAVVTIEVINNDGTWPGSKPRFGLGSNTRSSKAQPGLCGLSNLGNTCFMNSAIQCLSNTPQITDYILTDKFVDDVNTCNPLGMHGEIARTYAELIKVMWSGNHTSFLPREFKCAVSRFAPQFTGFAQQDCQELMAFLLDGLHEDLNRIKNKPYIETKNEIEKRPDEEVARESWENYKRRNDSIVVDTFHAMLKSTLVCPECKLVSVTFDPFCYLSLPLPVKREKQVTLTFLPAPAKLDETKIQTVLSCLSKDDAKLVLTYGGRVTSFDNVVEEHAGYPGPSNRPKGRCKMQVPRSGPASELCEVVARIINEERTDNGQKVQPDNLVVAEMAVGRISKIYESSEHYNQISDDIVVIEKASNHVVPVYVREDHEIVDCVSYGLVFVHVPDLKYDTLYQSILINLSNLTTNSKEEVESWCKLAAPKCVDQPMDCDETETHNAQNGDCNGTSTSNVEARTTSNGTSLSHETAFKLVTVNSFGSNPFETLSPSSSECDSSKLYLGATFVSDFLKTPQFEHNRAPQSQLVEMFTPKVAPKPTLQLKDCITQFTNAERLGADDPWYCPKCKKHQQAVKKFDIWSLPKVLIIHLKRFSYSRSWRDKIDTLVEFPVEGLDMSNYVHNPEQKKQEPIVYDLIGVANHTGGLGGGHYNAYAKNAAQDSWYIFDDALVSPTTATQVVTRSAYVLFYRLREDGKQ